MNRFDIATCPQSKTEKRPMAEKERVVGYVRNSVYQTIADRAEANEQSVSEFVAEACREKIERDSVESASQLYRFEERLLESIDNASERAADRIATHVLEELQAHEQPQSVTDESSPDSDADAGNEIFDWE